MLTQQQKDALALAVQALKLAGITAWFEARIIKDSDKRLNGRRISSKRRTDLDSVLAVADKKRVMMLKNMRMELRMYATAASSRTVFMGVEDGGDYGTTVEGRATYSPAKNVERLRAEGLAEDDPLMKQAQRKVRVFEPKPVHVDTAPHKFQDLPPLKQLRTVGPHTCDATGPMRQQDPNGPYLSTCSLCGEFNQ